MIDLEKIQYPPQSILKENTYSRSVNFIRVVNKMANAQTYAERRDGHCIKKTGHINGFDIYFWTCENRFHQ